MHGESDVPWTRTGRIAGLALTGLLAFALAACGGSNASGGSPSGPGESDATSYPAGPYGLDMGDTMANVSFQGYREGTGEWTTIQLSDYYDPDGSRGIRALYITLGEALCGACVGEAPRMNDWKTQYGSQGARFLSALWGGGSETQGGPANKDTIDAWCAQYDVTYDMVADPTYQLAGGQEPFSIPEGWLIDPRTMKVFTT